MLSSPYMRQVAYPLSPTHLHAVTHYDSPTGRYYKNSLTEILVTDFGYPKVYTVNRLDRLTSGCMIIALTSRRAGLLCKEFVDGLVKKEYIARCTGEFPE